MSSHASHSSVSSGSSNGSDEVDHKQSKKKRWASLCVTSMRNISYNVNCLRGFIAFLCSVDKVVVM